MAQSKLNAFFQPQPPKLRQTQSTAGSSEISFSRNPGELECEDEHEYFSVKSFLLQRGMLELDSPNSVVSAPERLFKTSMIAPDQEGALQESCEFRHSLEANQISDFDDDLANFSQAQILPVLEKHQTEVRSTQKPSPLGKRKPQQVQLSKFFSLESGNHNQQSSALSGNKPLKQEYPDEIIPNQLTKVQCAERNKPSKGRIDAYFRKVNRNSKSISFGRMSIPLIQRTFGFLTYADMTRLSSVCYVLHQSFRGMWFHQQFLSEMDLSKYSSLEIRKILQKSRLPHNKTVLGSLLPGKNLDLFLKRNKVAFSAATGEGTKPKGIISRFEVGPSKHNTGRLRNTLVVDRDITRILDTSHSTLTYCNLVSCIFITATTFKSVAKLKQLLSLTISNNSNFNDESAEAIFTNCREIKDLDISKCRQLTERSTLFITSNLERLQRLNISHNSKMLPSVSTVNRLLGMKALTGLDMSHTGIPPSDLQELLRITSQKFSEDRAPISITTEYERLG